MSAEFRVSTLSKLSSEGPLASFAAFAAFRETALTQLLCAQTVSALPDEGLSNHPIL